MGDAIQPIAQSFPQTWLCSVAPSSADPSPVFCTLSSIPELPLSSHTHSSRFPRGQHVATNPNSLCLYLHWGCISVCTQKLDSSVDILVWGTPLPLRVPGFLVCMSHPSCTPPSWPFFHPDSRAVVHVPTSHQLLAWRDAISQDAQ